MNFRGLFSAALLGLIAGAASAWAVDLAKIHRPLAKEPTYQSKAPQYCLLVFGPEAERRAWLVLDGKVLYVDRNGNGDLTEAGEKVEVETLGRETTFEEVELPGKDGGTKHKLHVSVSGLREFLRGKRESVEATLLVSWEGERTYVAWGDEQGKITFASRPADAPVVHIGGPLQMGLEVRKPLVRKSPDTFELMAAVGCKGLGKGTFASLMHNVVPMGVHPRAVLAFPAKTPGGPPVQVELALKQRC